MSIPDSLRKIIEWWQLLNWKQATYYLLTVLIIIVIIVLLLVYFFIGTSELIRGIITNLLSSIVGFLISLLFYRKIIEIESQERDKKLLSAIHNEIQKILSSNQKGFKTLESLKEMGITETLKEFSFEDLKQRIHNAKERVLILENWICQNLYEFKKVLQQADSKGVQIQILLISPDSPFAIQRARDLHQSKDYVANLVRGNTNILKRLDQEINFNNLELRYFNCLPFLQIFIIDNTAVIGFYLQNTESHNAPQLEIVIKDKTGDFTVFGERIEKHFESIWKNADRISLN